MGNKRFGVVEVEAVFDCVHFGHFNFLRQAAALGDKLLTGVHNDAAVTLNKRPPVFTQEERCAVVAACRWVDIVIPDTPWDCSAEWLDKVGAEVTVHGDEAAVIGASGVDCYADIKAAGRYASVPRTKNISSTNIIGRILRLDPSVLGVEVPEEVRATLSGDCSVTLLPSARRIALFSPNARDPGPDDRVVYVQGVFDVLHRGHVSLLEQARAEGTYLIVGLLNDEAGAAALGKGFPLLGVEERRLGLLALKYVDDVVIVPSAVVTQQVLYQVEPTVVVVGDPGPDGPLVGEDYSLVKSIMKIVPNKFPELNAKSVAVRVLRNAVVYSEKNKKKEAEDPDKLRLPVVSGA